MRNLKNQVDSTDSRNLDDSNSLIVVFDINDKIVGFNRKCELLTGYTFEEVKGQSIQDLFLLASSPHFGGKHYKSVNDKKTPDEYINCWKTRNGDILEITWSNQLLMDGAYKATHVIATGTSYARKLEKDEKDETNLQHLNNVEQQEIINNLLFIAMEDTAMDTKLQHCLENIQASSWIPDESNLEIYILNNEMGSIVLKTQQEVQNETLVVSTVSDYRNKICQKSINSGHSSFNPGLYNANSDKVDNTPYYSVPIKSGSTILAILIVHLEQSHAQDIRELFFLRTAANVLTVIIERYNIQASLQHHHSKELTTQGNTQFGDWSWSSINNIINCSPQINKIFGLETDNVCYNIQDYLLRIKSEDTAKVLRFLRDSIDYKNPLKLQHSIITPSGDERIVEIKGNLIRNEAGDITGASGTLQDVTDNLQTQRSLQLITHVFEAVQESIVICDADKKIIKANQMFTSNTGYLENEIIGKNLFDLYSEKQDININDNIWNDIKNKGSWHGEVLNKRKNGEIYPEYRTVTAITDEHKEISHYIVASMNITDKKVSEECIHQLVHYDSLTKLPNKSFIKQLLTSEIESARVQHKKLAVLFLNLDGLKRINDSMGHHIGDDLLVGMAQRLSQCTREIDIVSRWDSDEFVILLPNITNPNEVVSMINNIHQCIIEPISTLNQKEVVINSSIGVSLYPTDNQDATLLIQNAAMAMRNAESNGGNGYQFYTPDINIAVIERLGIETGLRSALELNHFELYYQPIIDIEQQIITGAEALIRWHHPKKQLISPNKFIPIAEDSHLIIPIGSWVLDQACQQCKSWQKHSETNLKISVNLSALQFRDKNLPAIVSNALNKHGLDPSQLTLELTESAVMDDIAQTMKSLRMLKDIGVSLSIDDFGTGYSSLAYLKRFPIDILKIDRTFVRDVDTNDDDKSIVSSIIALGNSLKLSIIAEGVEKIEHMPLLNALHCNEAQGYYISKPLPASEFERFVQQWHVNHHVEKNIVLKHAHV